MSQLAAVLFYIQDVCIKHYFTIVYWLLFLVVKVYYRSYPESTLEKILKYVKIQLLNTLWFIYTYTYVNEPSDILKVTFVEWNIHLLDLLEWDEVQQLLKLLILDQRFDQH